MKKKLLMLMGILAVLSPELVKASELSNISQEEKLNWNRHTISKTITYECQGEAKEYAFDQEITIDGTKYILKDSNYEVTDVKKPDAVEQKKKVVTYSNLTEGEVSQIKKKLKENGIAYELKETDVQEQIQTDDVTSYRLSGLVYEEPASGEYAKEELIEYTSPVTGEIIQLSLPFESKELIDPYSWRDGFQMNVAIEEFDAEVFQFGNEQLVLDKENPYGSLTDSAKNYMITAAGLPQQSFTIDSFDWTSDPYEKNGVIYRDATVSGKQYVGEYRYNYHDAAAEIGKLYDVNATYMIDESEYEAEIEAATIYQVQAEAEYQVKVPFTKIDLVLLIGILLFVLFFVLFLIRLNKKKKAKAVEYHVANEEGLVNKTSDKFIEK